MNWRRKWQPTPVFLPKESQGWGNLVGCCLWGRTESDTTEATLQQQQQHTECPVPLHLWLVYFCVLPRPSGLCCLALLLNRAQKTGENMWESGEEAIGGSRRVVRGGKFWPLDEPYEWYIRVLQA